MLRQILTVLLMTAFAAVAWAEDAEQAKNAVPKQVEVKQIEIIAQPDGQFEVIQQGPNHIMIQGQVQGQKIQGQPAPAVMEMFIADGQVKMEKVTFVGLLTIPMTSQTAAQIDLPKGIGLVVMAVSEESPASKAGLKENDILHKFDDQLLINPEQFRVLVHMHQPGETVVLTALRKGKPISIKVKLGQREVPVMPNFRMKRVAPGNAVIIGPQGQQQIPFGNDMKQRHEQLRKQLEQMKGIPGIQQKDIQEIHKQIEEQMKQIQGQMKNMQQGMPMMPMGQVDPKQLNKQMQQWMQKQGGKAGFHSSSSVTAMMADDQHKIRLTIKDGVDKHLHAEDKEGKVIFDGLINTPEERQAVPQEILEKVEKLESRTKVNIEFKAIPVPVKPEIPEPKTQKKMM